MPDRESTRSLHDDRDDHSRLPGLLLIVGALILPAIAWTHRPLDFRNFGDATMVAMRGDWVLKPPFFYGSLVAAAGLLIAGILKLRRPEDLRE